MDVRKEWQFRWYYLLTDGVEQLELAVGDLRMKFDRRIGWDAEHQREHDPLAVPPFWAVRSPVPFKGPGRPNRRGQRGTQTTIPAAADPDAGLFRAWPVPSQPTRVY